MKKGKIVITITIGLACFVLVMIMFMQFKVVYQTDVTSIDTMRQEELQAELANWKSKYEETEEKYDEILETLNKYREESNSDSKTKQNLEEELESLKLMLGITDVEGKGIIITLKESDDVVQKITSEELSIIVNYLKDAGAEAISINEQRIVNSSDFADITETFIKINGQRVNAPFTIKVIGEPDYLKSALIGTGYVDKIKGKGQEITFEEKKKVTIPKSNRELNTKYIEE